jgi:hypothetical protein
MKPSNRITLSTDPFCVVRDTAWQRAIKERLAKISYVNHNGKSASDTDIMQSSSNLPSDLKVKLGQDQFAFLKLNFFEIAVKVHFCGEICVWALANQSQKRSARQR